MARYRRVDTRIWSDEKFLSLSAPQPNAQTLWLFLLTGPFSTPVGVIPVGPATLAERLQWSLQQLTQRLRELLAQRLILYCENCRVIWLVNFLKYNPPMNPNSLVSYAIFLLDEVPPCRLKDQCLQELKLLAQRLGQRFEERLRELLAQRLPLQEQEQEQDILRVRGGGGCLSSLKRSSKSNSVREKGGNLQPELTPAQLAELYNQTCVPAGLPSVTLPLSPPRQKKARARLRDYPRREWWEAVFREVVSVPFLRGEEGRKNWRGAEFLWLIGNSENALKVYEKRYRDKDKRKPYVDTLPEL